MTVSQATFDAEMTTFNNLLVANWSTFSDAFNNYASDSILCGSGASNNTTYFETDKIHLNTTGRNYLVDTYKHPTIMSL